MPGVTSDRPSDRGSADVVGLIPAAGLATRLGVLPCSKEVLPLAYRRDPDGSPRAVSGLDRLLGSFAASGVERAIILLRDGKWDIPAWVGDGRGHGVDVAYRVLPSTGSVVETLLAAMPFLEGCRAALGFPDIVYRPRDSFASLAREQESSGAAVVLGLFPCDAPSRSDMVEVDDMGRVLSVRVKEPDVGLRWAWGQAVWDARFTEIMGRLRLDSGPREGELYPGHAVQRALDDGLPVRGVRFDDGVFLDTGTPEGLDRAMEWLEDEDEDEASPLTRGS